jgi:hypothetical protein
MPAVLGITASRPARALPELVTEPAFVAAGLGAMAMFGHAADARPVRHRRLGFYWIVYLYWIGAVPAVILLGLLVVPPAPRET